MQSAGIGMALAPRMSRPVETEWEDHADVPLSETGLECGVRSHTKGSVGTQEFKMSVELSLGTRSPSYSVSD